jgi:hypothetical protein
MRFFAAAIFVCATTAATAQPSAKLRQQFTTQVQPFLAKNCSGCHSGATPAGGLDLKSITSMGQVTGDFARWSLAAERVAANEMPPRPMAAPPAELTRQFVDWVHGVRADELRKGAGDPGIVLARRLSNAEYNATIRDLTGRDLQTAKQFPVDPANTAGFDNSGESLTMSPALLNKYLQGARSIADHAVFTADGIEFAPHPMRVETDREKFAIQKIMAFYAAQPTDVAKYFEAAWRFSHRAALGQPKATLAAIAAQMKLSPKYLPLVWGILQDKDAIGPVAKLQGMWNALPAPSNAGALSAQTVAMRDFVTKIRSRTAMQFAAPVVRGLPGQAQPLHNWRLKLYSENHRNSDLAALRADNEPAAKPFELPRMPSLHADASPRWAMVTHNARINDADLVYPAGQKARYQAAFARFASVFPDTFVVSERGRYWPDNSEDQGRFLSAGYHNTGGYYRDDTALMQLILDAKSLAALNRLWWNFDFYADQTAVNWTQYFLNNAGQVDGKGSESGLPRPLKHRIIDTAVIMELRDKHLAKAKADARNEIAEATKAINWHFALKDATMRQVEAARISAQPKHLAALQAFAARAWRRPLTDAERTNLAAYYRTLRAKNQLSHEDALRDSLVGVLMSPDFLYRFDPGAARMAKAAAGKDFAAQPISSTGLASRLSYFLWSSMPDATLARHGAAGDLGNPAVLLAETRRMLKDGRMQGLATEFTGNWLGVRQFEIANSVDRERFPAFNDDLKTALFQEPVRFVADMVANDRSVLELLYGDYTFVNPALARHYGMPAVTGGNDNWVQVDNAARYQRGGLLPMAVFMAQNSPGLRTSPVKRGNWVVSKVLGIKIPPPPPVVPELPADEAKTDLSVRETLAQHRANPMCAACHARFDSFGLAFEGFGPVGEARTKDLAGRLVDTSVLFPGDVKGEGVPGLKVFIRDHRQENFVDNFSRKLLAYALGRSPQLSDEGLIDRMKTNLAAKQYRFSAAVETIVLSPQFRDRRAALVTASTPMPAKPQPLQKINFQKEQSR